MKQILIILFLFVFVLTCGKKSEKKSMDVARSATEAPAPAMERNLADSMTKDKMEESDEQTISGEKGKGNQQKEGTIEKPLNPISDASKSRLLEYSIQLNYKVESIEKAREILLTVIKKDSYIASSQTNISSGYENMSLQVQIPVGVMYDTLLEMDKIGQLTYEDIRTQDWTEHNESQKMKLDREGLRIVRRSKALNKGSAENWNYKDREDALERSEDNADSAKLESWKIRDHVAWAKVNISIFGKELPTKIQLPNYRDAIISAINFLLELTYYIVWIIPIGLIGFLLFKLYRKIRG